MLKTNYFNELSNQRFKISENLRLTS